MSSSATDGPRRAAAGAVRGKLLGALLVAVLGSCVASSPSSPPSTRGASPPATSARSATSARPPTLPGRVKVENGALGPGRYLVRRAIADLKALGFWRRLTRHLYLVQISSRPGLENIPKNEHLADALLSAYVDERGAGPLCSIMFFPAAIERDLARQNLLHSRGLLQRPAPSVRHFYAALLAHELAHCLLGHESRRGIPTQGPEPLARRWEDRVLEAASRAGPP